jgi:preprotein translocase subunit SecA
MRGIDTAIIDEADSVLIDEAVTPLIISQPQKNSPLTEACQATTGIACQLTPGLHYRVDRRYHEIHLTGAGEARLDELCAELPELWQGNSRRDELVVLALTANEFYHKNQQYVIEDDKVVIVDDFTGRMMPQRTWRQGLHQLIEAKEKLPLSDPSETLVRMSFQRYFRFFRKLGGMTGTAREAAGEFWHIYGLSVHTVPTNRPCIRKHLPARFYSDQQAKWQAICDEVCQCHYTGQPVLIGTRSIATSEKMAALMSDRNITFQLLNADKHQEEAKIIASAGQYGTVTIATNMAGRGADIKLGKGVAELGGLHTILSEHHESKRIDRQLFGRCGRQGEPGTVRVFSSMEDEVLQRYGSRTLLRCLHRTVINNQHESSSIIKHFVSLAQDTAEKQAFRQRKEVMQKDVWLTDALSFARSDLDTTF